MKPTASIQPATALILARQGSKGVPGKNTAIVGGKPCVEWTIRAAQASSLVDRVIVSTDCVNTAAIARNLGCEVVERPASLASDTATVDDAARHAVSSLGIGAHATDFRRPIAILYANVPVRPIDLIDRGVRHLCEHQADSVQSYGTVGKHHPWWTCRVDDETGAVQPWEGDTLFHGVYRRQALPPAHVPDGGVTVVTMESLMLEIPGVPVGPHAFLGRPQRRYGVITREGDVVDIDTPIDLIVADAVLKANHQHSPLAAASCGRSQALPHPSPSGALSCS